MYKYTYKYVYIYIYTYMYTETHFNTVHHTATQCKPQHYALCGAARRRTTKKVHCNTLQHSATHTLQYAPRGAAPRRPTITASTVRTTGSTINAPRAGIASEKIACFFWKKHTNTRTNTYRRVKYARTYI